MATKYSIAPEIQGVNGWGLGYCTNIYSATLAITTDTTLTVPGVANIGTPSATTNDKLLARISYTAAKDVFVALGGTAAAPAGAGFAASTSSLNPPAMFVKRGDVLHFFAFAANTNVTVEFFALMQE